MDQDDTAGQKPTPPDDEEFKVDDRRHWTLDEQDGVESQEGTEEPLRRPSLIEEYRGRAEKAETKLREYIAAYKSEQKEQDAFRARLSADIDRRVDLKFGDLVAELLETLDDLDRGLSHAADVPAARPLAEGVTMARDRFLATLERNGIEAISPEHGPFDPNESEAVRVDPVDSEQKADTVTETLQTGYRLGERVIRPARVAVGRYDPAKT